MKLTTIRAVAAATAGFVALGAGNALAKDLKVGVPTFLTGAAGPAFGIPARNGAKLMIDNINAGKVPGLSKGFAGAKVDAIYYDESGGNTKQVTELRNKVQKENVDMMIGYISSGSCAAVAPVAEQLKVLTFLAVCGTPRVFEDLVKEPKYVFRTMNHATASNVSAAHYVAKKYANKKGFTGLNQNYAWGQDSWRDFDLAIKVLMPKMKEVGKPQFPKLFSGQYGTEISALLRARADVIHSSFWGGDLEALLLQGNARGLFKKKSFVLTVGDTVVYRLGKKFPEGQMVGSRGPYGIYAVNIHNPMNDWFQAEYRKEFKEPPTQPAYQYAQAVIGAKYAFDTAAKANGGKFPSTDQVIKAMEGATFQSLTTKVAMSMSKGHQAVTGEVWGVTAWDSKKNEPTVTNLMEFAPECVNPPDGVESVKWLEGGMKGAKCN